jgi:hypothetical protein
VLTTLVAALNDWERHSTALQAKIALQRGSLSSLYTVRYISPFSWKVHPESWSTNIGTSSTTSTIPDNNHPSSPDEIMSTYEYQVHEFRRDSKWRRPPRETPESLSCHHFVMCSGQPSMCWLRPLLLYFCDQQRHSTASPEKLAFQRGCISSMSATSPGNIDVIFIWMFNITKVSTVHNDNHVVPEQHQVPT